VVTEPPPAPSRGLRTFKVMTVVVAAFVPGTGVCARTTQFSGLTSHSCLVAVPDSAASRLPDPRRRLRRQRAHDQRYRIHDNHPRSSNPALAPA
jgi:hypothetical protein